MRDIKIIEIKPIGVFRSIDKNTIKNIEYDVLLFVEVELNKEKRIFLPSCNSYLFERVKEVIEYPEVLAIDVNLKQFLTTEMYSKLKKYNFINDYDDLIRLPFTNKVFFKEESEKNHYKSFFVESDIYLILMELKKYFQQLKEEEINSINSKIKSVLNQNLEQLIKDINHKEDVSSKVTVLVLFEQNKDD